MNIFTKARKFVSKYTYRQKTVFFAALSLAVNVLYAVYNGAVGIYYSSWWLITMSFYYTLLGVMRYMAVQSCLPLLRGVRAAPLGKQRKPRVCAELGMRQIENSNEKFRKEIAVMRNSGILLLFLTLALIGTVILTMRQNYAKQYGTIIMITIAAFTFYKITTAIINAVKAKKQHSPICRAIRNITCADAAMSVLPMQSSMIVSFEKEGQTLDFNVATAATGSGICVVILYLGISMLVGAGKLRKQQ